MSEPATTTTTPPPAATTDERVFPGIIYALYILSFFTVWFTALIGVIAAYVLRDKASEMARSHYDFLISTFWWSIPPLIIGTVLAVVGVVLMIVLIGFPILFAAGAVFLLWFIWFVARCIAGAVYLAKGEPYPRPGAIFI